MFGTWFYEHAYCTDSDRPIAKYQEENNWRYVQHHKHCWNVGNVTLSTVEVHSMDSWCYMSSTVRLYKWPLYIRMDGTNLAHQHTLSLILGNMVQAHSNSLLANLILYWWYSSPLLRTVVSDHSSNHSYLVMVRMVIQDFPGARGTHRDIDNTTHTIHIGYYTGSRSVRLDIFTSLTWKRQKRVKNIQQYWTTNCVINYLLYDQINQGKNEFSQLLHSWHSCAISCWPV